MNTNLPILVVDDVSAMREIIVRQLRSRKFENVQSASNATEAFRMLETQSFRLVLADWHMPGVSGLDLLNQIRSNPRLRHISFILMTADLPRGDIENAVQAGIDDFMLKPFTPAVLEAKIHTALAGIRHAPPPPPAPEDLLPGETAYEIPSGLPTILVVDDIAANLTLASSILRHEYQVKLAVSGKKALALCEAEAPDLVLLDIMMPDMDGFEVCHRLKENPATAHIPVIFVTALEDVDHIVSGLKLGAVDYVAKPMEPVILKARVANALRIARAHEELRSQYDLMIENIRLREDIESINRHDIKNPLAAILSMTRNLQTDTVQNEDSLRMLRFIESATVDAVTLLELSSGLLMMEQRRYPLTPEPVDLVVLMLRVSDEARLAFAAKGVRIAVESRLENGQTPMVDGEMLLLYSMLHNLVKNAAEAVQMSETVRLVLLQDDDGLHLEVRNPGTVPAEIRPRFFEKYVSAGKTRGSGLGTYSARLIAETHHAAIEMRSSDTHGTVVTVSFPLPEAGEEEEGETEPGRAADIAPPVARAKKVAEAAPKNAVAPDDFLAEADADADADKEGRDKPTRLEAPVRTGNNPWRSTK